jgi:hypothetical protein
MDVNSISQLATAMSATQTNQDIGIAVLRKALDSAAASATELIDAVPQVNLPPHLGQTIDTTA